MLKSRYRSSSIFRLAKTANYVKLESSRIVNDKETNEERYFISSLALDAQHLLSRVRDHWGIENSLHWVLDVTFKEDDSRIRNGYGQENFSFMRKMALNLIKINKPKRLSVRKVRLSAGWNLAKAVKYIFGN